MKKQIFSVLVMVTFLFGCSLNRNYTQKVFKTTSNKIVVTGVVYNTYKNKGTIAEAGITAADTTYLTKTDDNGKYRIELTEGKHILRAAFIGFKIGSTRPLKLVKGDSVVLDFVLKESFEKTIN